MIRCTLLSDGSSDDCLIPAIEWTFNHIRPAVMVDVEWADIRRFTSGRTLFERIPVALDNYPSSLLLVHRDAERDGLVSRVQEIDSAASGLNLAVPYVPIVPVKMSESWLLINEAAIRRAAGNPNGRIELDMPRIRDLEGIQDPKEMLNSLLRVASERKRRDLKKFYPERHKRTVANFIPDFAPLLRLESFSSFRDRLSMALERL